MDPLNIILSALALGGTTLQPIKDQAIKDGYVGLKSLVLNKFKQSAPELENRLAKREEAAKVLQEVGADQDQEVVDRATNLLKLAKARHSGNTQITAEQVAWVEGDNAGTITLNRNP